MTRLLILALFITCPALAADLTGLALVVDGDTIAVQRQFVRLYGIDAPELHQQCQRNARPWDCGRAAADALREKIGSQPVTCEPRGIDRYKRRLAVCRVAGEDLNGWLVSIGLAIAYTRYSADYEAQEAEAKAAHRGLWAGEFVTPEAWRNGVRRFGD